MVHDDQHVRSTDAIEAVSLQRRCSIGMLSNEIKADSAVARRASFTLENHFTCSEAAVVANKDVYTHTTDVSR